MTVLTLAAEAAAARAGSVPCRTSDSDLWFADDRASLRQAQTLCGGCPLRAACLAGAIDRGEPWGVWGGELFERGQVIAQPRPKGRPRKDADLIAQAAQRRLSDRLAAVGAA